MVFLFSRLFMIDVDVKTNIRVDNMYEEVVRLI